jgi:hypothetical protein
VQYSENIERQFNKVFVGKQMKFKTNIETTKNNESFVHSSVQLTLTYDEKLNKRSEVYQLDLPLTPYNIATPLRPDQCESQSFCKESSAHYVTPLYSSCEDLLKKGANYLEHLFPHGEFDEETNTFTVNYLWKERMEKIKIKLKERAFRIEGVGQPLQTGR